MLKYILQVTFLLFLQNIFAQSPKQQFAIVASISGNSYQGDFTGRNRLSTYIYPSYDLGLQFYKNKNWVKSLQFGYGVVAGQKAENTPFLPNAAGLQVNSYFYTPYFYTALRIKKVFLPHLPFQPYIETGIGAFRYTPLAKNGFPLSNNTDSRIEGEVYNSFSYYVPASLGFVYRLSRAVSLQIAYNYLYTGSDYLDNIGKVGSVKGNDAIQNIAVSAIFPLKLTENIAPQNLVITSPKIVAKPKEDSAILATKLTNDKPQKAKKSPKVVEKKEVFSPEVPAFALAPKADDVLIPKNETPQIWDDTKLPLTTIETPPPSPSSGGFEGGEDGLDSMLSEEIVDDSTQTIYEHIKAKTQKAIEQGYFLAHFVVKNETIYHLSLKYEVTKESIYLLNALKSDLILEGETLKIPDVSKVQ